MQIMTFNEYATTVIESFAADTAPAILALATNLELRLTVAEVYAQTDGHFCKCTLHKMTGGEMLASILTDQGSLLFPLYEAGQQFELHRAIMQRGRLVSSKTLGEFYARMTLPLTGNGFLSTRTRTTTIDYSELPWSLTLGRLPVLCHVESVLRREELQPPPPGARAIGSILTYDPLLLVGKIFPADGLYIRLPRLLP